MLGRSIAILDSWHWVLEGEHMRLTSTTEREYGMEDRVVSEEQNVSI